MAPSTSHPHWSERDLERESRTIDLLEQSRQAPPGRREQLLDEVVLLNLEVARAIARRYRNRGEPDDDLVQVASLGRVKAARGYDPARGETFLAYAVPTLTGEIKRHFRDRGWDIRPPRRVQDLRPALTRAREELSQDLGRSPTVQELCRHLGVDENDVTETLASASCYSVRSLDAPVGGDDGPPLADVVADRDEGGLDGLVDQIALEPLLAQLPERDRHILCLRFYQGWTQSQIAEDVGVTQMQVSRVLSRVLSQLRVALSGDVEDAALAS
jgi:RNA polymerase sigma-B factor